MSAVRLLILVIAAVAAIALAFVVRGAFSPKKPSVAVAAAAAPAAKPTVRVLVAKRDLPIGTRLTAADLGWQDWPAEGLSPTFTTDGAPAAVKPEGAAGAAKEAATTAQGLFGDSAIQALDGAVVREPFVNGEPIVARKIVKQGEGNYLAVVLAPGMRAMSVGVTVDTAAGGFVLPGDRVDVIVSRDDGDKGVQTETVLRNVKVLAIDQAAQPAKDAQTMVGAVATLEVSAADTELVAAAQVKAKGGALSLALRSYADAGAPTTRGSSSSGAGSGQTVRVFRAGQASQVTVSR